MLRYLGRYQDTYGHVQAIQISDQTPSVGSRLTSISSLLFGSTSLPNKLFPGATNNLLPKAILIEGVHLEKC